MLMIFRSVCFLRGLHSFFGSLKKTNNTIIMEKDDEFIFIINISMSINAEEWSGFKYYKGKTDILPKVFVSWIFDFIA